MAITKTDLLEHRYQLILMELNEVPVGEITQTTGLSYSPALADIGELSFSYPKLTELESGEMVPTPLFEELEEDMLLLLDGEEYYYIDSCVESDADGLGQKQIHAYSRQYELSMKNFNDYDPETEKFLYFIHPKDGIGFPWTTIPTTDNLNNFLVDSIAQDGYPHGIFNTIERYTTWRLERGSNGLPLIPAKLKDQVRFIKTTEANILEVLKQIQEAWNCLFVYDTLNRVIKIITKEDLIETPNGVLSDETFILSLTKEFKKEEVKTRLFMYNMNGVGVLAERMAHGNPYIEDYSYFKNDKYMTSHLQAALDTYTTTLQTQEQAVIELWGTMRVLLYERKATEAKIDDLNQAMQDPLVTYNHYVSVRDGFVLNPGTPQEQVITAPRALTPQEQNNLDNAIGRMNSLEIQLNAQMTGSSGNYPRSLRVLDELIDSKMAEIRAIQNVSLMPDVFGSYEGLHGLALGSLMKEMEPYIRDATFTSDSIEDARDLHSLGKDMIARVSKPRMQFTMDLVNFLDKVEFKHSRFLATLGQVLRVESKNLGFTDNVILLRYTHNPEENSLVFEFSSDLEIKDDTTFLAELISKSNSISSQVAFNSNYWGNGGSTGGGFGPGGGSGGSIGTGGMFDNLFANVIQTNRLVANSIETTLLRADEIYAKTAEIGSLVAGTITAGSVVTDKLSAIYATIEHLNANYIDVNEINANFATIDLLNVGTGSFDNLLTKTMIATDGLITNLKIVDAQVVSLDAGKISTGTLSVDRLIIRNVLDPTKSLMYAINNIDGALQSITVDTINGEVLTNNTIHAEKIIAESITAREIAAGSITADEIKALSITAGEIQGNTITANEMATGTITAASGIISSIDANVITTGTLSANRVRAGLLKSTDNQTWIDLDTGYFNFKDRMKMDANGFELSLTGNQTVEEYIDGQVGVNIQATPAHQAIPTTADGVLTGEFIFTIKVGVQKGFDRINAIIATPALNNGSGVKITDPGIYFTLTNPTTTVDGSVRVRIVANTVLPTDTGTLSFEVQTTNPTKTYLYSVGWSKAKGGSIGVDGVGVSSITPEYAKNTSKTTPPIQTSSLWSATPPPWTSGSYVWSRNKIVYTNSATPVYTTPIVDSAWEAVNGLQSTLVPMINGKLTANQQSVFNALTVNGTKQGLFLDGSGNLWVNGYYISAVALSAISADLGTIYSGDLRLNRGANGGRNYGHLNADKFIIGISDNPDPYNYPSYENYQSKLEIDSFSITQRHTGTYGFSQIDLAGDGLKLGYTNSWADMVGFFGLELKSNNDVELYSNNSDLYFRAQYAFRFNKPIYINNSEVLTNGSYINASALNGYTVSEILSYSGNNGNGHFVRFRDGTLIMWSNTTLAYSSNVMLHGSITFPYDLYNTSSAIILMSPTAESKGIILNGVSWGADISSTTSAYLRCFPSTGQSFSSALTKSFRVMIIGRWKA